MKRLLLFTLLPFIYVSSYAQWWSDRQIFNQDTIRFDRDCSYLEIDSSAENIWQIGKPSKSYFNSAWLAERAIMTDSIHPYPIDNYSWFELYFGEFNLSWGYPNDIFVQFHHKFDTDSLKDGGYITVSYDNGITWSNIIHDNVFGEMNPQGESGNLYTDDDLLFNGEEGFSGRSDDWITTWFAWYHLLAKKSINAEIGDTMILRFNFVSDSIQTNKEGWLIDDIRLFSVDLGGGIENQQWKTDINIYPNPVNSSTIIDLKNPITWSKSE